MSQQIWKREEPPYGKQAQTLLNKGHAIQVLKAQTLTPSSINIPEAQKPRATHFPLILAIPGYQIKKSPELKSLDGFVMLEATGMGFPEDGRQAKLCNCGYNNVVVEDLGFFTGLVQLDVSENCLNIDSFQNLPRLRELNLSFNSINELNEVQGFGKLQSLDLSYNNINPSSLLCLSTMPVLRELNLSGNNMTFLPFELQALRAVEHLYLEYNKLGDNSIFDIVADMPMLRNLTVAHNLLSAIPQSSCAEGKFRLLDTLDLSYNYFGTEASLEPTIELPRLGTLLIYGNPVLGPTGEDPNGIYVESLIDAALCARQDYTLRPLEIILEAPRKRDLKKGRPVGKRQVIYKDFDIIEVETEKQVLKKTAKEYKQEGLKTLFSQAVDLARKNNLAGVTAAYTGDNTFLTSTGVVDSRQQRSDEIADKVMQQVAESMNLIEDRNRDLKETERIPADFFNRSLTEPQTLKTYPICTNAAIRSLRFAIKYPLTNYDEVPSSSLHPSRHFEKTTVAHEAKKLEPKQIANKTVTNTLVSQSKSPKSNPATTRKSVFASTMKETKLKEQGKRHRVANQTTLRQVEEVLDGLNVNTTEIVSRQRQLGPDSLLVAGVPRPSTGINGLVDMIHTVIADLES